MQLRLHCTVDLLYCARPRFEQPELLQNLTVTSPMMTDQDCVYAGADITYH